MIDNSYLLGLFGLPSTALGGAALNPGGAPRKAQPTPPWDAKAIVPEADALVRAALGGRRIINEDQTQLDVPGAGADYRKLFAVYQGLNTLVALTNRASVEGLSSTEQALLSKRFGSGLDEVASWLGSASFDDLRLVQGISASTSKSTAAVTRDSSRSLTAAIHEGSPDGPVAAFQGDVRFSLTVNKVIGGVQISSDQIDIDLSEMGAETRTMTSVIAHINGKLEAAGVQTRMGRELIPAEPRTIEVGGKTIDLPDGLDRWALAVQGSSVETVAFSAPDTADAVYVLQGAGTEGGHQLLKFQTDLGGTPPAAVQRPGETHFVEGRSLQSGLPDGVESIRASATAADGSLWVLANLSDGTGTQPIKGESDVALMKYDTAGRLMFTRALGAASEASGYALSVAPDGRVAVAGSVTGALEPGAVGVKPGVADSFVSVFDADGLELWTQRRGATAADEATAVTFGADGTVYVAGRSKSAMPGAGGLGGWDSYVQAFSQSQAHQFAPVVASQKFVSQFGGAGEDGVSAMAVDGSTLITAGVESGRAIVRRWTINPTGGPTLESTRDLGVMSGEIAGVAIDNGKVIVAGTTRNGALDAGVVTNASAGGDEAFVASLNLDLAAAGTDRLSYYGGAGDDTVADVKISGGKVWLSGVSNRPAGAEDEDPTEGYLARLDPVTGAVEWSRTWKGDGEQAAPMAIAVGAGGASVLDRLGLPQGEIGKADSKRLIDATAARVGDRFYVSGGEGGRAVAVKIEARDTLQSLARKIEQASQMRLKVTVVSEGGHVTGKDGETTVTAGGYQRLSIAAREGRSGAVLTAGEIGRDALAALGLSPGFVGPSSSAEADRKSYGLDLPNSLNLDSVTAIKHAGERLQAAMSVLRDAYRDLAPKPAAAITGQAPAYLTAKIANYQEALARLGGGG